MSTTIGKQQTTQVDHARATGRSGDIQNQAKKFNPQDVTSKPATPLPRGQDLFSQVIAEATDGDATEAAARAALGLARRDGVKDEGDSVQQASDERVPAGRRPRPGQDQQAEPEAGGDPVVNSLKRRKVSSAPASVAEVASPKTVAPRAEVHEALMRITSTMQKSQVATHVSHTHSESLLRIQQQSHWAVQRGALDDLNAAQMAVGR
jgi:hypothetical protein